MIKEVINYKKELYNLVLMAILFNIIGFVLPSIRLAMIVISIYCFLLSIPGVLSILDDSSYVWDSGKKNR